MLIRIGLENGYEAKSIAWVLDHPGCFTYGKDGSEAIIKVPQALISYQNWIGGHANDSWLADLGDFDVRLTEVVNWEGEVKTSPKWFEDDRRPLTHTEIEHGLQILTWSRDDLLEQVNQLSTVELDQPFDGERWPIRGILEHVAGAEFWYLGRLGLIHLTQEELAEDVFERLSQVRRQVNKVMPDLAENGEIREVKEEKWSARRVLRQLAWHERGHIQHVLRLMTLL